MSRTRRSILGVIAFLVALVTLGLIRRSPKSDSPEEGANASSVDGRQNRSHERIGVEARGVSVVYSVSGGTPEENVRQIVKLLGGIQRIIGKTDIVIVKPNAQRFNQGMTNTDAMRGFIDLILGMEGFSGEVIIAENHQYQQDDCCGWVTKERNGRHNLNELVKYYQDRGFANVTKYQWHVAGPCTFPLEGDGQGDSRVSGPEDGDGYVWLEDCFYLSPEGRKCLMTYPIFTSAYSGVRIDLKNGPWKNGRYLDDRRVRFINFSALNHHGRYAGVSASVKNLMGVVDMTCGFPGDLYPDTYNTHHIGVSRKKNWLRYSHWRIHGYKGWLRYKFEDFCYRNFHHTGGALGYFIANVRAPDLNVIAAELVGWGDRKNLAKAFRPKAILASVDPVALDYIAARDILLPGTPEDAREESGVLIRRLNDPDNVDGPFHRFLLETHRQGIGNVNPENINVIRSAAGQSVQS